MMFDTKSCLSLVAALVAVGLFAYGAVKLAWTMFG